MQDFDQLKHASQQTRNVWLTYLGLIAYLGIAVAAVRDIDFFSVNASVQLPLVGVNVPSLTFMWAGATVLFAVFIYLHIFTEKLIISISQASTGADNSALENAASAWLVADLVYSFRVKSEGESQWQSRTNLWILGVSATLFLNWAAGILLILAFFYRSLPAQNIWLSGYLAVIFSICVVVSSESARAFLFVRHDMRTIFIPLRRILFLLSFIIFSSFPFFLHLS